MSLIVFDMDGTLIDTQGLISEHMSATFAGAGLSAPTAAESRRVIGLSLPIALSRLAKSDDHELVSRLVESYRNHYRASVVSDANREALFPGALQALNRLRQDPTKTLGIATGKGLAGVNRILELHGLTQYFATLQTPDHNPSKPNPGMLLTAMDETGSGTSETIMIGDTTFDLEMGRAAGVRTIGVTWGYHEPSELIPFADTMIDAYDDLDDAIQRLLE
ncbi:HAD-IA family hydrolase [Devosia rhodophyticola]|uniref:HAD-IA family hydrolase n=1 Tax=Devosia rhodophyticola TaxID=3026423 RepID=A0ABY7YXI6_9HYPH|nr:HAD-IA family hydrolase [Devosia rhodophyticola]WDR05942.1 HAD-IA family hydrolase [Devosia rhodophyticola]